MQLTSKQKMGALAALAGLMALTRYNHFGSEVALPDASLAVFFLAGVVFPRMGQMALLVLVGLLLEAGAIDYYATQIQGVSDWCITPAYWFLIPTYAVLWLGGSWFARRMQMSWRSLAEFGAVAWLCMSVAFVMSNASFYLWSDRLGNMSVGDYVESVGQYYLPYLTSGALYLLIVAASFVPYQLVVRNRAADTFQN